MSFGASQFKIFTFDETNYTLFDGRSLFEKYWEIHLYMAPKSFSVYLNCLYAVFALSGPFYCKFFCFSGHYLSSTSCGTVFVVQLQECMVEHRDWRQCQNEVQRFRQCMASYSASGDKDVTS